MGLLSKLGRFPGEGNGNSLQYSCLENYIDRGALWATVHGSHKDLDTTELLSTHTSILTRIIKELSTNTHNTLISFPERSLQNLLSSPKLLSFKGTFQDKCLKFMLSIAVIFLQEFQVWHHILISCS